MTEKQHAQLKKHLFPEDGKEAVALVLCGRSLHDSTNILCVHEILTVPYEKCRGRSSVSIEWPVEFGLSLYDKAARKGMGILKLHSHPNGLPHFSSVDETNDARLLSSLVSWTEDGKPHCSAVMLPDGSLFGSFYFPDNVIRTVDRFTVAGTYLTFYNLEQDIPKAENTIQLRTRQAFGDKTTSLLATLKIAVVGCSGTGSWVVEQLARLGVGRLVLIDPKPVEDRNLNRIVNTRRHHSESKYSKVKALAEAIQEMGTGTQVSYYQSDLMDAATCAAITDCDVVFGCMDTQEGRAILNEICVHYIIPYLDIGVLLEADGKGSVSTICGSIHFLRPDGPTLLDRGTITSEDIAAEGLKRTNPDAYRERLKEGYIKGVKVDSPAVVSINGFLASAGVNELLARLHPFRQNDDTKADWLVFDLVDTSVFRELLPDASSSIRNLGRGDRNPLLGIPSLGSL